MEAAMAGALLSSQLPADVGEAIRTVKGQLRSQIGAVAAVFAEVEQAMRAEAAAVATDRAAGRPVWPVVRMPPYIEPLATSAMKFTIRIAARRSGSRSGL